MIPMNTFELIALNMSVIYQILRDEYSDIINDEEQLLLICGVIDLLVYLKEGSIKIDAVRSAVRSAKLGECSLDFVRFETGSSIDAILGQNPQEVFLNFILQIEALIMHVDNPQFSAEEVIRSVLLKKDRIREIVGEADNNYKECRDYKQIKFTVEQFFSDDAFKNIRDLIALD